MNSVNNLSCWKCGYLKFVAFTFLILLKRNFTGTCKSGYILSRRPSLIKIFLMTFYSGWSDELWIQRLDESCNFAYASLDLIKVVDLLNRNKIVRIVIQTIFLASKIVFLAVLLSYIDNILIELSRKLTLKIAGNPVFIFYSKSWCNWSVI